MKSASAAYDRLQARLGTVEPSGFLTLSDEELRADGFSRQKTGYVRGIAQLIETGALDLVAISHLDVGDAIEQLVAIRGIGPWTASCFVLFVNNAPDVWPTGDRALYVSMHRVLDLDEIPVKEVGDAIAAQWSPHRSTAARMLWHDYLGGRAYLPTDAAGFGGSGGKVSP